jgi:xanthosine utilization system XapX-like protein
MTFIVGFALGVLVTIAYSLLSIASDADDHQENLDD